MMLGNFISKSLEFPFKKKTTKFYKIFIIFTCLVVFFGLIFYKTSVIDIFKYVYSQLFFVLLPGLFFCDLLKKFQNNFIKKITMSYGIGVALTIIEYFVFYTIDFKIGLYYFGPILSILEIILVIKRNGIKRLPLQITNKVNEIITEEEPIVQNSVSLESIIEGLNPRSSNKILAASNAR